MFNKLRYTNILTSKCPSLPDIDPIYRKAICELPVAIRKAYCERLLNATEFELKHTDCGDESTRLKQLNKSAQNEFLKLEPTTYKRLFKF